MQEARGAPSIWDFWSGLAVCSPNSPSMNYALPGRGDVEENILLQRELAYLWTEWARCILSALQEDTKLKFPARSIYFIYIYKSTYTHIKIHVYIPICSGHDSSIDYAAEETSTKELSFPNQTYISSIIVTLPRKLRIAVKLWHFALLAENFLLASVDFGIWSLGLSSSVNTSWVRRFCAVPRGISVFLTRPGGMMSKKHFTGNFSLRFLRTDLHCESQTTAALHFYHICY